MKILFLSHYFPPEGNAPASRTYDHCKRWVAAGHDVTVITCAPNVPDGKIYKGYQNKLKQEEWIDGIQVIRVWTFIAANKGTVRRTLNYLSYFVSALVAGLFMPRPDILICTSPQFFCGMAGVILGRIRRLPRILEVRDIWPESIATLGAIKNPFLIRIAKWLELFMYRSANIIVTVGPGYRDKLLERDVPASKLEIITNGADLKFYCPGEPDFALRKRYRLEGKFTVAFVGTIGIASGLEVILEASRKLNEAGDDSIRFLLVGDGAVRAELESQAEKECLQNVIFTGRLDKSLMPSILRSVDSCLIHLRKTELFKTVIPSKLFEAFATKRPVILGVDGSARDILEAAKSGLFIEPGNADALIEAVRILANNPIQCQQFSENGLAHVIKYYNRDELANKYCSIMEQLLNDT